MSTKEYPKIDVLFVTEKVRCLQVRTYRNSPITYVYERHDGKDGLGADRWQRILAEDPVCTALNETAEAYAALLSTQEQMRAGYEYRLGENAKTIEALQDRLETLEIDTAE